MLLMTELLRWWYTAGWRGRAQRVAGQLDGTIDYFSMDLLAKTLFSPFRQISAGKVDGSLEVQLRAFTDKLFSRLIGGFVRSVLLIVGSFTIAFQVLIGLLILIGWALLPLLPIIGLILGVKGQFL